MEIIQTIWTALTTENEVLAKIILIPEIYIETLVDMLLFCTLFNFVSDKTLKIRYILTFGTLSNITNILVSNPYRSFLNLILLFITIHYFFKTNTLKTILSVIIPLAITVFCESVFMKICVSCFYFDATSIVSIPLYRLLISLAIQILVYLVYLLIKYFRIQISILENMSKKNKMILLVNFIFATLVMTIQFLITGFYMNKLPWYIVLFSNFTLISYFLLSIYSLTRTNQLAITSLDLEQEKEHNRILKLAQDDLRGFRHDFANIMCTIGGYVHVKDMEGLSGYYSQIQKDVVKVNNLSALDPSIINNPAVFTLIASKYDKAVENNITMHINCLLDLDTLNMKIYEFTRILGILLDNSIEAAKECDEKVIYLEIRKDTHRNRQLLLIENTYQNKEINIDKIFEKNYSTKKGNSGIGLWEVRQILKRNTNLNLFTSKDARLFKQQLEMYNL